jgi:hypothetical protein
MKVNFILISKIVRRAPDIRIRIRRCIVEIPVEQPSIQAIVPSTTAHEQKQKAEKRHCTYQIPF